MGVSFALDMTGWTMKEHGVPDSKWTVIQRVPNKGWLCRCECGAVKICNGSHLRQGNTKSCGCGRNHNQYNLSGEFGVGWDAKGDQFYFSKEDYPIISLYAWYVATTGYVASKNNAVVYMHSLLLSPPHNMFVDHINGNRADNRRCNLRLCTRTQNNQNKRLRNDNSSGVTGVLFDKAKKRWAAHLSCPTLSKPYRKYFLSKEEAIIARLQAEKQCFGEFAPQRHLFKQYGIE